VQADAEVPGAEHPRGDVLARPAACVALRLAQRRLLITLQEAPVRLALRPLVELAAQGLDRGDAHRAAQSTVRARAGDT
jgi:hypothetical protein